MPMGDMMIPFTVKVFMINCEFSYKPIQHYVTSGHCQYIKSASFFTTIMHKYNNQVNCTTKATRASLPNNRILFLLFSLVHSKIRQRTPASHRHLYPFRTHLQRGRYCQGFSMSFYEVESCQDKYTEKSFLPGSVH